MPPDLRDLAASMRQRAQRDPEFAEGLDAGYAELKIDALLRNIREQAGLTQEKGS